jgi:ActR/RegA family two-component response regulator
MGTPLSFVAVVVDWAEGCEEYLQMLKAIDPDVRILVSTNGPAAIDTVVRNRCGITAYVAKPFSIEDLSEALQITVKAKAAKMQK